MKVTIKDVAKDAGVSPSTVSRVISDNSRIGEATKVKVRESIKKMGYTPNIFARSLVRKETKIIGVVMPHEADSLFSNPFFIQAMKGISISAENTGYHIMYAFGKDEESELKAVKNFVDCNIVDGICLLTVRKKDKCIDYLQEHNFPFVVIGTPEGKNNKDILWVDNDNISAVRNIVKTLANRGHKTIGHLGAKENWTVSYNRKKGFVTECMARDIEMSIIYENDFTVEMGYQGAKRIFEEKEVTAIVCSDDILAFGVQKYLLENNKNDVEIFGFNRIENPGTYGQKFSSVNINSALLGREAINLLISKLNLTNGSNYKIVETKLEMLEGEI